MSVQILGKRVLIKRFSKEEERIERAKKAGIILEKRKDHREAIEKGEILKVGRDLSGWEKMIGQKVIFNAWAGDEVEINNQKQLIVHIDDILAIYS